MRGEATARATDVPLEDPLGTVDISLAQCRHEHVVLVVDDALAVGVDHERVRAPVGLGGVPQPLDEVAQHEGAGARVHRQVERAVEAQERIARLARLRYREGVADYLEVLDAERNLFSARQQLLATERAWLQNRATLFVALGGGGER